MEDIEYFNCECMYHKYGYVLCPTCADILGASKQCDTNDCQQTESKDLKGTVLKHDN